MGDPFFECCERKMEEAAALIILQKRSTALPNRKK